MANTSVCHLESRRTRFGNPRRVSQSEGWYYLRVTLANIYDELIKRMDAPAVLRTLDGDNA